MTSNNKILLRLTLAFFMLFSLCTFKTFGQTLKEDKVDEFTNQKIKRTSWETLNQTMAFAAYFRISRINDQDYFDLKLMIGVSVFSIEKDQEIMLKLSNGEIVKLPNCKYAITCKGCGANGLAGSSSEGIQVSYLLNKENFEKIKNSPVAKIRIYTNDGYVEEECKEKYASKILKAINLIE